MNIILLLSYFIMAVYGVAIVLVFFYSLAQLNLLVNYLRSKKKVKNFEKFDFLEPDQIPFVTIQLPIFNEKYVVERLLNNIAKLEYPSHKIEIQVLDDSTDDSLLLTRQLVENLQAQGINIKHITRRNRVGFKAGALKEGLITAKGEFVAVFDADFMPNADWLLRTIPYFKNPQIGVVQTRWSHLNRDYSWLTKIQAFALDAHFTFEQAGRNAQQHCINFNGTAGVWRKSCIIDAGNWESDTLTEDLDLSYRAQLKNWKFIYLEHVATPAELPAVVSAARSQQFRWNKGGAENFVKMFWRIVKSENLPLKSKFHAILHLSNSSMFLCVFAISFLSVPVLFIKNALPNLTLFFNVMTFFVATSLIFFGCYWVTYRNVVGKSLRDFVEYSGLFFVFYAIAMGFAFQNSLAVLEGLWGKKSEFIRTPKLNIESLKERWKENVYLSRTFSKNVIFEALLMCYFAFALYSGFKLNDFDLFPFHLMLFFGYNYLVVNSLRST